MVTPQTNATLEDVARALLERDDFVIAGHIGPDGDCLGSQLALWHALRSLGKRAVCVLAKEEPYDRNLAFLPGIDQMVPALRFEGTCGTFVALDVPTPDRMGDESFALREKCAFSITVDHHAVDSVMSDLNYVDPDAAATALLVWRLTGMLGVFENRDIATCAYTGLMTDTGRFQFQNTNVDALRAAADMVAAGADPSSVAREVFQNRSMASVKLEGLALSRMRFGCDGQTVMSWLSLEDFDRCDAVKADAESLVNTLRSIRGVRVACMLREQSDSVRGSFRAKDDTDVSAIAKTMNGGGHKAAAGFTLYEPLETAVAHIETLLASLFVESSRLEPDRLDLGSPEADRFESVGCAKEGECSR